MPDNELGDAVNGLLASLRAANTDEDSIETLLGNIADRMESDPSVMHEDEWHELLRDVEDIIVEETSKRAAIRVALRVLSAVVKWSALVA